MPRSPVQDNVVSHSWGDGFSAWYEMDVRSPLASSLTPSEQPSHFIGVLISYCHWSIQWCVSLCPVISPMTTSFHLVTPLGPHVAASLSQHRGGGVLELPLAQSHLLQCSVMLHF